MLILRRLRVGLGWGQGGFHDWLRVVGGLGLVSGRFRVGGGSHCWFRVG